MKQDLKWEPGLRSMLSIRKESRSTQWSEKFKLPACKNCRILTSYSIRPSLEKCRHDFTDHVCIINSYGRSECSTQKARACMAVVTLYITNCRGGLLRTSR